MSAVTAIAGYPCHRVTEFHRWTNKHAAHFTDWRGACGAVGFKSGHAPFGTAGEARRLELCTSCFPGRKRDGAFGDPVEVPERFA